MPCAMTRPAVRGHSQWPTWSILKCGKVRRTAISGRAQRRRWKRYRRCESGWRRRRRERGFFRSRASRARSPPTASGRRRAARQWATMHPRVPAEPARKRIGSAVHGAPDPPRWHRLARACAGPRAADGPRAAFNGGRMERAGASSAVARVQARRRRPVFGARMKIARTEDDGGEIARIPAKGGLQA